MNGLFDALFPILFVAAGVWLVSVFVLIRRLEYEYPETYQALGEPRFLDNSSRSFLALLRFILKREHQSLNNPGLSLLCDFMRILFVAYLVGFILLLVSILIWILQ